MGGGIAAAFASTFPTKVNTVTLIASVGTPSMTRGKQLTYDYVLPVLLRIPLVADPLLKWILTGSDAGEWVDPSTDRFRRYSEDLRLRYRVERALPRSMRLSLLSFPLGDMVDTFKKIRQQGTPTLVMWGANDASVHPDGAQQIKSYVPHARVCMHPSAGHPIVIEFAEFCAEKMHRFYIDNDK